MALGWLDADVLLWAGVRGLVVGVLLGGVLGVGEELLFARWSRRLGFMTLNVVRLSSYTAVLLFLLVGVNAADSVLRLDLTPAEAVRDFGSQVVRDFSVALVMALAVTALMQIRRLHNPGEISRLLSGRYHYPEEEDRIFLFADLAGSTTLAEQLGHVTFSNFLRDVFADVSEAILAWRGQVYQHVGDGVIVTWHLEEGLREAACVRCYFEMIGLLAKRDEQYRVRYGVLPQLRAAVHGGPVVTTWVGEVKTELAFHGDTLNATSRIESMCRELGENFLVSEQVYARVELPSELHGLPKGEVQLRGKSEPVRLFAVRPTDA